MQCRTFENVTLKTLSWHKGQVIDWSLAGTLYAEDGKTRQLGRYHYAFSFDSAVTSADGTYAFIYKKLGTKGLLLKNGEVMREINRSYYQAEAYEYPAVFLTLQNGRTCLIHCPEAYNRIDIEDVESGQILTAGNNRNPEDFFHSRLEVSPDQKHLLSKGWVWHPFDMALLFDIEQCLKEPSLLDKGIAPPGVSSEVCTAAFIDNKHILLGASEEEPLGDEFSDPLPPQHLAVWNISTGEISKPVRVEGGFGNLLPIDENYCFDLFGFPKVIELKTGKVIDRLEAVYSGMQNSSIMHHIVRELPLMAYDRDNTKIALINGQKLHIISR